MPPIAMLKLVRPVNPSSKWSMTSVPPPLLEMFTEFRSIKGLAAEPSIGLEMPVLTFNVLNAPTDPMKVIAPTNGFMSPAPLSVIVTLVNPEVRVSICAASALGAVTSANAMARTRTPPTFAIMCRYTLMIRNLPLDWGPVLRLAGWHSAPSSRLPLYCSACCVTRSLHDEASLLPKLHADCYCIQPLTY